MKNIVETLIVFSGPLLTSADRGRQCPATSKLGESYGHIVTYGPTAPNWAWVNTTVGLSRHQNHAHHVSFHINENFTWIYVYADVLLGDVWLKLACVLLFFAPPPISCWVFCLLVCVHARTFSVSRLGFLPVNLAENNRVAVHGAVRTLHLWSYLWILENCLFHSNQHFLFLGLGLDFSLTPFVIFFSSAEPK